ncbi:unnamed protein product, partial [Candidula unifasciata]
MAATGSVITWIILVAIAAIIFIPHECGGRLVVRQKDLVVDIGRSTYLTREDLAISTVRRGESCRVEVATADPITQRVGRITPP